MELLVQVNKLVILLCKFFVYLIYMLYCLIIILLIFICYLYYCIVNKKEHLTDFKRQCIFSDDILKQLKTEKTHNIDKLNGKKVTINTISTSQYLSHDKNNTLQSSYVNSKPTIYKLIKKDDDILIQSMDKIPHYLTINIDGLINMSINKDNKTDDNKWMLRTIDDKLLFKPFLNEKLNEIPNKIIKFIKKDKGRLPKDVNEDKLLITLKEIVKKLLNNINSTGDLCNQEFSFVSSKLLQKLLKKEIKKLCERFKYLSKDTYFIQSAKYGYFVTKFGSKVQGGACPTINDLWKISYVY